MSLYFKWMESPVGKLKLAATDKGLAAVLWEKEDPRRVRLGPLSEGGTHPILLRAESQLGEYFDGGRRSFDLELDPAGTPFQRRVWRALSAIPFGEVRSYGQIARGIGHPAASRAVGAANGKNPLSIVVPCHRVIGASGKLTGFAGGLAIKAALLTLERDRGEAGGKWALPSLRTA